jgi:hypothetical protein
MKRLFIGLVTGLAILLSSTGVASANGKDEQPPGPSPQLDQLCLNVAFSHDTPVVVLNGQPLQNPRVGLRSGNGYCSTQAVNPSNYGEKAPPKKKKKPPTQP